MIEIVSYSNFFLGSLTVAGALTGLLFVALSVAQEKADVSESLERQAVAATAFTALVDALWVSLAVGIARSWELLGLRGGGILDLLAGRPPALQPGSPPPPASAPTTTTRPARRRAEPAVRDSTNTNFYA